MANQKPPLPKCTKIINLPSAAYLRRDDSPREVLVIRRVRLPLDVPDELHEAPDKVGAGDAARLPRLHDAVRDGPDVVEGLGEDGQVARHEVQVREGDREGERLRPVPRGEGREGGTALVGEEGHILQ